MGGLGEGGPLEGEGGGPGPGWLGSGGRHSGVEDVLYWGGGGAYAGTGSGGWGAMHTPIGQTKLFGVNGMAAAPDV